MLDGWSRVPVGDTPAYVRAVDLYNGEMRVYIERGADGWRLTALGGGC
jgi:hypothetical protein